MEPIEHLDALSSAATQGSKTSIRQSGPSTAAFRGGRSRACECDRYIPARHPESAASPPLPRLVVSRSRGSFSDRPLNGLLDKERCGDLDPCNVSHASITLAYPAVRPRRDGRTPYAGRCRPFTVRSVACQHIPWGFPRGHRRDAEQIRHRLTGLVAAAQLFGVIGNADRVPGKFPAMEIAVKL